MRLVDVLLASGIELHDPPNLYGRALELASLLSQGAVYDAHYMALAEALDCELWTAGEKFFRAASTASRNVRWIRGARSARIANVLVHLSPFCGALVAN